MIEISNTSHHGIYSKIMGYVDDLESHDLHRRQMAVLKNTMVKEWLYIICKRLDSYNECLQDCCIGVNSVQKFARFMVQRRLLTKYFMTYREFCMCDNNYATFPPEITNVLFESFLWISKYKNHPRLMVLESPFRG